MSGELKMMQGLIKIGQEKQGIRYRKAESELPAPAGSTPRPRIVCLCGSTRFWKTFQEINLRETRAGKIVLSIGAATGSDTEHLASGVITEADKQRFDELHKRKIDLADEVLILNVNGYIGTSTRSELEYAIAHSKLVRWLEPSEPND